MSSGTEPSAAELARAGLVVDKAIEHLAKGGASPIAVASALLGGALALLSRTMDDAAILGILDRAAESVRAGELRRVPERS